MADITSLTTTGGTTVNLKDASAERSANKVTSITSASTNTQYPSAAAVYALFLSSSGSVSTATGTISTSATTASVSYSGTLVDAYATMSGERILLDMADSGSAVTFTCAAAPSAAVTCTVVYLAAAT